MKRIAVINVVKLTRSSGVCLSSNINRAPISPGYHHHHQPYSTATAQTNETRPDGAPRTNYNFIISPAFASKRRRKSKFLAPKDTGEDAYFYTLAADTRNSAVAFGVADGVGGWVDLGVDPAEFSHTLCSKMAEDFKEYHGPGSNPQLSNSDSDFISPRTLLDRAYSEIKEEGVVLAGGSTACVGVISSATATVAIANLGDSGFLIYRGGRVYKQSSPQTHAFNTPYQLAIIPPRLQTSHSKHINDSPADSELSIFHLHHGDVIVMATDGFTDNVSPQESLSIVNETMLSHSSWINDPDQGIIPGPEMIGGPDLAKRLVKYAHSMSHDPYKLTPFAKEVEKEMKIEYRGGKPDDITVLVLMVQSNPRPSSL